MFKGKKKHIQPFKRNKVYKNKNHYETIKNYTASN